ncbi:hypothetical protein L1887_17624 [Cichorium endivia]|nr:hypothetical protein L1887_17624 [Cichorium endivia]
MPRCTLKIEKKPYSSTTRAKITPSAGKKGGATRGLPRGSPILTRVAPTPFRAVRDPLGPTGPTEPDPKDAESFAHASVHTQDRKKTIFLHNPRGSPQPPSVPFATPWAPPDRPNPTPKTPNPSHMPRCTLKIEKKPYSSTTRAKITPSAGKKGGATRGLPRGSPILTRVAPTPFRAVRDPLGPTGPTEPDPKDAESFAHASVHTQDRKKTIFLHNPRGSPQPPSVPFATPWAPPDRPNPTPKTPNPSHMPRCTLKIEKKPYSSTTRAKITPSAGKKGGATRGLPRGSPILTRVAPTPFRAVRDPLGPTGPTEPDPKDAESFAHASVHTQDRKKNHIPPQPTRVAPTPFRAVRDPLGPTGPTEPDPKDAESFAHASVHTQDRKKTIFLHNPRGSPQPPSVPFATPWAPPDRPNPTPKTPNPSHMPRCTLKIEKKPYSSTTRAKITPSAGKKGGATRGLPRGSPILTRVAPTPFRAVRDPLGPTGPTEPDPKDAESFAHASVHTQDRKKTIFLHNPRGSPQPPSVPFATPWAPPDRPNPTPKTPNPSHMPRCTLKIEKKPYSSTTRAKITPSAGKKGGATRGLPRGSPILTRVAPTPFRAVRDPLGPTGPTEPDPKDAESFAHASVHTQDRKKTIFLHNPRGSPQPPSVPFATPWAPPDRPNPTPKTPNPSHMPRCTLKIEKKPYSSTTRAKITPSAGKKGGATRGLPRGSPILTRVAPTPFRAVRDPLGPTGPTEPDPKDAESFAHASVHTQDRKKTIFLHNPRGSPQPPSVPFATPWAPPDRPNPTPKTPNPSHMPRCTLKIEKKPYSSTTRAKITPSAGKKGGATRGLPRGSPILTRVAPTPFRAVRDPLGPTGPTEPDPKDAESFAHASVHTQDRKKTIFLHNPRGSPQPPSVPFATPWAPPDRPNPTPKTPNPSHMPRCTLKIEKKPYSSTTRAKITPSAGKKGGATRGLPRGSPILTRVAPTPFRAVRDPLGPTGPTEPDPKDAESFAHASVHTQDRKKTIFLHNPRGSPQPPSVPFATPWAPPDPPNPTPKTPNPSHMPRCTLKIEKKPYSSTTRAKITPSAGKKGGATRGLPRGSPILTRVAPTPFRAVRDPLGPTGPTEPDPKDAESFAHASVHTQDRKKTIFLHNPRGSPQPPSVPFATPWAPPDRPNPTPKTPNPSHMPRCTLKIEKKPYSSTTRAKITPSAGKKGGATRGLPRGSPILTRVAPTPFRAVRDPLGPTGPTEPDPKDAESFAHASVHTQDRKKTIFLHNPRGSPQPPSVPFATPWAPPDRPNPTPKTPNPSHMPRCTLKIEKKPYSSTTRAKITPSAGKKGGATRGLPRGSPILTRVAPTPFRAVRDPLGPTGPTEPDPKDAESFAHASVHTQDRKKTIFLHNPRGSPQPPSVPFATPWAPPDRPNPTPKTPNPSHMPRCTLKIEKKPYSSTTRAKITPSAGKKGGATRGLPRGSPILTRVAPTPFRAVRDPLGPTGPTEPDPKDAESFAHASVHTQDRKKTIFLHNPRGSPQPPSVPFATPWAPPDRPNPTPKTPNPSHMPRCTLKIEKKPYSSTTRAKITPSAGKKGGATRGLPRGSPILTRVAPTPFRAVRDPLGPTGPTEPDPKDAESFAHASVHTQDRKKTIFLHNPRGSPQPPSVPFATPWAPPDPPNPTPKTPNPSHMPRCTLKIEKKPYSSTTRAKITPSAGKKGGATRGLPRGSPILTRVAPTPFRAVRDPLGPTGPTEPDPKDAESFAHASVHTQDRKKTIFLHNPRGSPQPPSVPFATPWAPPDPPNPTPKTPNPSHMPRCTLKIEKKPYSSTTRAKITPSAGKKGGATRGLPRGSPILTRVAPTPFRAVRDPLGPTGPTEPDPKDAESFAHASVHTQDRKKTIFLHNPRGSPQPPSVPFATPWAPPDRPNPTPKTPNPSHMPRCTLKIEKKPYSSTTRAKITPSAGKKGGATRGLPRGSPILTRVAPTPFRAVRDPLGPTGPTEPDPKDAESFAHASVHTQDRKKTIFLHNPCKNHAIRRQKEGCNTRTSQGVTHPSTTLAQARLTAEF